MEPKILKNNYTFEQLCIRKEVGYSCDISTMFMPSNPESFDDVVFKIISKIDTSLLLLKTHGDEVENFTLITVPISNQSSKLLRTYQGKQKYKPQGIAIDLSSLQHSWDYLLGAGWHGLQSVAVLRPESIPDNGSRMFSLYQYATSIMDVIRANYMFQKHRKAFVHETLEMFDDNDIQGCTQAIFGLLWKRSSSLSLKEEAVIPTQKRRLPLHPLTKKLRETEAVRNRTCFESTFMSESKETADEMEVDEEISFKTQNLQEGLSPEPVAVPEIPLLSRSKGRRASQKKEDPEPTPTPTPLQDITLSFETSVPVPKGSRKSMARKSLASDWPEDERDHICQVFDDLNPGVAEQKRIAFTCKYVALHFDKDLPSKLLYQWVQKKGRRVNRTITSFSLEEGCEKDAALKFYKSLDESCAESARISCTTKYLSIQFGITVTSKQLYAWLNEKPNKVAKRR